MYIHISIFYISLEFFSKRFEGILEFCDGESEFYQLYRNIEVLVSSEVILQSI